MIQVTQTSDVEDGDILYLGITVEDEFRVYTGTVTSSFGQISADPAEWQPLTAAVNDDGFTLSYGETTYISWSSGTSFATSTSSGTTLVVSDDLTNYPAAVKLASSSTARYAGYGTGGSTGLRWYASSGASYFASLYKNYYTGITLEVSDDYKTAYTTGETWSTEGITVNATDVYGTTSATDEAVITFSPEHPDANTQEVTITATLSGYTQSTTVSGISYTEKTVTGIDITTEPTVKQFNEGDALTADGIVVTVAYSDTTTSEITDTSLLTFDPALGTVLSTVGTQTVTVSYSGYSDSYEIEVAAYPLTIVDYDLVVSDFNGPLSSGSTENTLETGTIDGYEFTPEIILGSSASSYYFVNDGDTIHIGTSSQGVYSFSLYSEILAGGRSKITSVVWEVRTNAAATVSATMNGETVSQSVSSVTSVQAITLDLSNLNNPVGHLELKVQATSESGCTIYLRNLKIYALGDEEANEAATFAAGLEEVDTCDTETYGNALANYAELDGNQYVDGILLDDYLNVGDADKTRGLVSVADKIAAMTALAGEAEANVLGLFDGDRGTMVIGACILLAAATIGAAAYILIRKKRTA